MSVHNIMATHPIVGFSVSIQADLKKQIVGCWPYKHVYVGLN